MRTSPRKVHDLHGMACVSAGLIDPSTGRVRLGSVRGAIRALTGRMVYPVRFETALAAVMRAARKEAETVARIIAGRAEAERFAAHRQFEARLLAARYEFDVDRLSYEVDRRSFGSFTLTLDGAPAQRDRFRAALAVAQEHHAAMAMAAE